MKYILTISMLISFAYGQLPAGKYLKVKDDGTGFELFTLTAVPGARLADSMTAMRAAMSTATSGYALSSHTHAYSSLTGLPTLFTQATADGLYSGISHTHTGVYQPAGTYATGTGTASGTNTGDNAANTTYANDYRAANFVAGTNYLAPNGSAASLTNFPTLNQNTTGTAAGLSAPLSFANGGISASAPTSATTGTITVNMISSVITCTPTGAMTLNASGGVAGQIITFSFTTSGTTSFVITFGTNFRKTGTLATGTTSARFFTVTFRCLDGTIWSEISRTAAQT